MSIGRALKSAREAQNISQEWLAYKLQISQSFLSKIENNPQKNDSWYATALCKCVGY